MPMPKTPGGHQPAPILGISPKIKSTILSEGLSIPSTALFSEPAPFAAILISKSLPGTRLT